jgi:hypothetical protein
LRLLLDENLGESVRQALHRFGHDLATVQPRGGHATSDFALIAEARAEGRVLVALDEGFADTVRFDPVATGGIVVINLPDERQPDAGAPKGRLQQQFVDLRRAVVDLAAERKLLEDRADKVEQQCTRLKGQANEALSAGRGEEAHDLVAESRDAAVRLAELRKRRDAVRSQEDRTAALADSLGIRASQVAVEDVISRAQTLIDSVGVLPGDGTLAPEPAVERRRKSNCRYLVHEPGRPQPATIRARCCVQSGA